MRDMQNEVMGVVLTFVRHSVLSPLQHTFDEYYAPKVELGYQYELERHPYSDKLSEQLALLEEASSISQSGRVGN